MRSGTIAFLLGVLVPLQGPVLADPFYLEFLPLLLLIALLNPQGRVAALFGCGVLWCLLRAHAALLHELPAAVEGRDLRVEGVVASIPVRAGIRTRFRFDVDRVVGSGSGWRVPGSVMLAWYGEAPALHPGERWRFTVRLKRPHGLLNPGGFDYERWLFEQGIRATGYVRGGEPARHLGASASHGVLRLRARLARAIDAALGERAHSGLVQALAIGVRDPISEAEWDVLRATGTSHLVAISGLHVGLVAGVAYAIGRFLWSLPGHTVLLAAAPRVAALAALLAATGYAMLAGFSVPTRRALIMIAVAMLTLSLARNSRPGLALALALLGVLLLDPFSVLGPGFWLSFGAVAVILLGMRGRLGRRTWWWEWGRVQWLAAVGLLPLTVLFFGQHPLCAPLANILAVPWVGLVAVPLVLLGTVLVLPLPALGAALLELGRSSLALLWPTLQALAHLGAVYHVQRTPPFWAIAAAAMGVVLILLPRGIPARWLGLLWMLPALIPPAPVLPANRLEVTVLDVGQGLAVVLRTRHHLLVYDTGPRYGPTRDAGRDVLLPYLRSIGAGTVDLVIVSHGDGDHSGGLRSLRRALPIGRILSSAPLPGAAPCRAGLAWRWDGFEFRMLHPPVLRDRGNDDSCVLRVSVPKAAVLLPGDIEIGAERELLADRVGKLRSTVLIAPHHGSTTSSSAGFVDAVAPRHVVFAVGYRNRFGFPRPEIIARYRSHEAGLYATGRDGAVRFTVDAASGDVAAQRYRVAARRFWNAPAAGSLTGRGGPR